MMEGFVDPLLRDKGVSAEGYGSEFSALTKKDLKVLGAYLQLIWTVKGVKGKSVPVDAIINNVGMFFTDPVVRAKDVLWIHHCASSLRELVTDLQIPEDFICALKWLPSAMTEDGSFAKQYARIKDFKDFFNDVTHFKDGSCLEGAKKILGDNKITELNDEIFQKIGTTFIYELYNFFAENCLKNRKQL